LGALAVLALVIVFTTRNILAALAVCAAAGLVFSMLS
jgi:hypothetical protein